ncbi:MAG: PepSY domain-containing protein [Elusimicrobiota bacterium]|nr:PepSY domain-containing protein [Elusimicrobiota bacterium]
MKLILKIHKYFGLFATLTVLLVSATGVLLVHAKSLNLKKTTFRLPGAAAPRTADAFDLLAAPAGMLSATKQGVFLQEEEGWRLVLDASANRLSAVGGEHLAFAKEGLFSSRDGGRTWTAELAGSEARAAAMTPRGLAAATADGVYARREGRWERLAAFERDPNVRDLLPAGEGMILAAKEGVLILDAGGRVTTTTLPLEAGKNRMDLGKLVLDLHTGEFFGPWFFLFVDLTGLALIALSLSGVYIWYRPWMARRQARARNAAAEAARKVSAPIIARLSDSRNSRVGAGPTA